MENNTSGYAPLPEECQPLSPGEIGVYEDVSWWFEGLLQCCVGSVGFLANVTVMFAQSFLMKYVLWCKNVFVRQTRGSVRHIYRGTTLV